MRIYLDVSCLDRPFDDQWQQRIRLEAEAVVLILERIDQGDWEHVSSDIAMIEIAAMTDLDRKRRVQALLPRRSAIAELTPDILRRAGEVVAMGFRAPDAAHITAA